MILQLYLVVILLGLGSLYAWALRKESIAFMSLLSTTNWGLAAMSARNITLYHDDGTSTVVGNAPFQYVALGIALLSFIAFVLWYFGEYPPEDAIEDELDPSGKPTDGGI
jgi:hypothetical protein